MAFRIASVTKMATATALLVRAGFLLAGLIIEALTNRPLHEADREVVLDPTGTARHLAGEQQ